MLKRGILGEGAYGIVYKGKDIEGNEYAIKRSFGSKNFLGLKNIREINFLRCLRHSCVIGLDSISVGDPFTQNNPMTPLTSRNDLKDDSFNIIMEKCESNLYNYSRKCRKEKDLFPLKIVMCQLLAGLEFLEKKSVIHRDIKPENCLINLEQGAPYLKICDFGLSRNHNTLRPSTPGTVTIFYRAPEICARIDYDCKADVWSAACVFYYIVTGFHFLTVDPQEDNAITILNDIFANYPSKLDTKYVLKKLKMSSNNPGKPLKERMIRKMKESKLSVNDFNKTEGNFDDFIELMLKMFEINVANRFSATQCLESKFFDFMRKTYINDVRKKNPVENYKERIFTIKNCKERRWGATLLLTLFKKKRWVNIVLAFMAMEIFDRYLTFGNDKLIKTKEYIELTMNTIMYMCYKHQNVLRSAGEWKTFFDKKGTTEEIESIERFILIDVLDYELYVKNLADCIDEDANQNENKILERYLSIGEDYVGPLGELYSLLS